MAQTDGMFRLLWKEQIVGYEYLCAGKHHQAKTLEYTLMRLTDGTGYIQYDSFDLGVQVNGCWYFEGDILLREDGEKVPITFDEGMLFVEDADDGMACTIAEAFDMGQVTERVGNIHEEAPDAR